jgi:hypothetical protein
MKGKPFSGVGVGVMLACLAAGLAAGRLTGQPWYMVAGALAGAYFLFAIRVVDQWEKVALLRFGKYRGLRGPGLFFMVPVVDALSRYVDQRVRVTTVSAESALTRDTVPVNVARLHASVAQLNRDLDAEQVRQAEMPDVPAPPPPPIPLAVIFGEQEFTKIQAPAIAIFACPHSDRSLPINVAGASTAAQAAVRRDDLERCTEQSDAFEKGNPADPVVRIANADHAVFNSNPKEVERAMNDFLAKLR